MRVSTAMPRILLLLFAFSVLTLTFIAQCGLKMGADSKSPGGNDAVLSPDSLAKEYCSEIIRHKEEKYLKEIKALKEEVNHLKKELISARTRVENSVADLNQKAQNDVAQLPQEAQQQSLVERIDKLKDQVTFYQDYFLQQTKDGEILHGVSLANEYELFPFCTFTLTRIYLTDPGLGKRVVEKPIGYKKKDLLSVLEYSIKVLNTDRTDTKYTPEDFVEGLYRSVPGFGTHYELYFKNLDNAEPTNYRKLVIHKPSAPIQLLTSEQLNTKRAIINVILPLSGRTETFQHFMDRFIRVGIKHDHRIFLTVVYFGEKGLSDVKNTMADVSKNHNFRNMKLVTLNETFQRGRGLQVGAQSWTKGEVILFLCDVDMVFTTDFLERCRRNTAPGRKVYYPIVFSLYNPNVVYSLQDVEMPPEEEQLIISKDTGFWRDFGYGMTCQYRSDFMKIRGFDEDIQGWGMEDVLLYRKYIKSDFMVVRATDPGIFHLWHSKHCDPNLPSDQYRGCIRSKALNEASHAQLGMLAFKDEINIHRSINKHAPIVVNKNV